MNIKKLKIIRKAVKKNYPDITTNVVYIGESDNVSRWYTPSYNPRKLGECHRGLIQHFKKHVKL